MPQFDFATYSSQIFWFSICFITLYYFISRRILPRVKEIIENRTGVIDSDTNLAKKIDQEVAQIKAVTDKLRNEANNTYQSKIDDAIKGSSKAREEKIEALKTKIEQDTVKSREELQKFVEKSQKESENVIQEIIKSIKTKVFN